MGRMARFDPRHSRKVLVAVVDGNAEHRAQLAGALTSFYQVAEFAHGGEALDELGQAPPCLLVVDEQAPAADHLFRQLRSDTQLADIPVICTTRRDPSGRAPQDGIDAFLEKPYRRSLLLKTISSLVNKSVEAGWEKLPELQRCALRKTVEVFNSISDLIERGEPLHFEVLADACRPLVQAVAHNDYRTILGSVRDHDNYSYVHSLRVGTLLSLFGYTIGLRGDDLLQLGCGGLVHDIGKMAIPHEVLNKPGKLTAQEWTVMQSHVKGSIRFLRASALPRSVVTIAAQHHEKLNGSGYPFGLKGRQLNELARMASIVDVFSALTDRRVYKEPMAPQHALDIMTGPMGEELDQNLLALFRGMLLEAAGV
ncbi:MAG: HD domain-containing protein [Rhodospirillaceae bacterium]|nr:HD domain-containing protein [Rhodospirillales bacterium]